MKLNKKELSQSSEDYLETIHLISQEKEVVRVKDIANHLKISLPSVTTALKKLAEEKLVIYEKYGYVKLTNKGKEKAKEVYAKHKLLFEFFTKILGIDSETAEIDACKIEHGLSKKTLEKLIPFITKMKGGNV